MSLEDRLTSIFDVFSRRAQARAAGYQPDEISEQVSALASPPPSCDSGLQPRLILPESRIRARLRRKRSRQWALSRAERDRGMDVSRLPHAGNGRLFVVRRCRRRRGRSLLAGRNAWWTETGRRGQRRPCRNRRASDSLPLTPFILFIDFNFRSTNSRPSPGFLHVWSRHSARVHERRPSRTRCRSDAPKIWSATSTLPTRSPCGPVVSISDSPLRSLQVLSVILGRPRHRETNCLHLSQRRRRIATLRRDHKRSPSAARMT